MDTSVLIQGGAVLTPEGLRTDWGVRIADGRIAAVGPNGALAAGEAELVVDARGQVILPGFVNGHTHMYGVLSHGISTEAPVTGFSSFLEDFWWPRVEDRVDRRLAELTAKWACIEMIESGVTTFFDILEGPNALPGVLEAEAEAVREAGLRALLSFEACERVSEENGCLGIQENADFFRACGADGLVQGVMSIHTLFTCSPAFIRQARQTARELGAKFHMHLSESVAEPNWCMERHGVRPVSYYDSLGALDAAVIASQLVQVDAAEIDILRERGVNGVSMPLSNCEVGGGIAPVTEMLDSGMLVGLGSDGYINNFFEVMRGAFLIHKAHRQDPQVMDARRVYTMATEMGARALGFADSGSIRPGYLADIITVRIDDAPTPINERNLYDQLVLFRNPGDVRNVFVNGRQLMRDGALTTLDKAAVRAELRRACAEFWASGEKLE